MRYFEKLETNYRQHFSNVEVDNLFPNFAIFIFFKSWWPERFALALGQIGNVVTAFLYTSRSEFYYA